MSVLTNAEIKNIQFQAGVYSRPLRTNFENIKNAHNDLEARVSALATPPVGSEVTDARDYATVLRDRLQQASKPIGNVVIDGLTVSADSPPNLTVDISAGDALVNGVYCYKSGVTTTANISTPSTVGTSRYSIVVMNSDNSISVVSGSDHASDPVLPAIAISQRPLAIISLAYGQTTISTGDIKICKSQGCILEDNTITTKWYFRINDAITDATDGAKITVGAGHYYEEINLSGKSNLELDLGKAIIYRPTASSYALKSINTVGNEESNITVYGGDLRGNSKAGAYSLVHLRYTDYLVMNGFKTDANTNSTATYKEIDIDVCDNCRLIGLETNYSAVSKGSTKLALFKSSILTHDINTISSYDSLYVQRSGSISEGDLFDSIVPYLEDGQTKKCYGQITGNDSLLYMTRNPANKITLYGTTTSEINEDDPTTNNVKLAFNIWE